MTLFKNKILYIMFTNTYLDGISKALGKTQTAN